MYKFIKKENKLIFWFSFIKEQETYVNIVVFFLVKKCIFLIIIISGLINNLDKPTIVWSGVSYASKRKRLVFLKGLGVLDYSQRMSQGNRLGLF